MRGVWARNEIPTSHTGIAGCALLSLKCAWAASVKKHCFLHDRFWRLAGGGNRKRALMAIAHSLLGLIYTALTSRQPYQERGAIELDEAKRQRLIRHHIRRLGKLGICFSSRL